MLGWADELRRLQVRANADNPKDAAKARSFGAEGIGLCRTEHMFFGADRDSLVKEMFLAAEQWRRAHLSPDEGETDVEEVDERFRGSLAALRELQRSDFEGIFRAMAGLEVTIRLLDPPLHEFLPVAHFEDGPADVLAMVRDLQEANPMLGTRGVRLAILYPPIYEMQVRAIIEAAAAAAEHGDDPQVEIMLPLIAYETELERVRSMVEGAAAEAQKGGRPRGLAFDRDDARAAARLPGRGAHRAARRLLQLRDQRPDPDGHRALARRRRGEVPEPLHRARDHRPQPVRDDRRAGGWGAGAGRHRARARGEPRAQGRCLRRARRGSRQRRLLPPRRARLRQLLALPGADREGRGGSGGGDRPGQGGGRRRGCHHRS